MKVLSLASSRSGGRPGLRVLIAGAAVALLILAARLGPSSPARAGDQGAAQEKTQEVVARYERTLAGLDRRLSALARLVFDDAAVARPMRDQTANLPIQIERAKTDYLNAQLLRQVAEIALREYVEGTSVEERAADEGEIIQAKSDLERSQRDTAEAKVRLARISAVADNSAFGLSIVYTYTDRVTTAELLEKKTAFALKAAESKKKVLIEYTILKRKLELESDVKKAHSDELAKQAIWELSKGKLEAARRESESWDLPEDRKHLLALIDRTIPLEEKIRSRLAEGSKSGPLPESISQEIGQLTHDLAALVDRAESLRDIGDFGRLKTQIQQAARHYKVSSAK